MEYFFLEKLASNLGANFFLYRSIPLKFDTTFYDIYPFKIWSIFIDPYKIVYIWI